MSLYHFPSTPLTFTTGEERTPPQGYRLHDFLRVSGDWKATGESLVVTAIYPRQTRPTELTSIKPFSAPGAEGFDAMTPKGYRMSLSSRHRRARPLKDRWPQREWRIPAAHHRSPDGIRRGVALGCKSTAHRR